MPRGSKPGDGWPPQAVAAAVAAKRARMADWLATGQKRCPQCCAPGETLPLMAFARARRAPSGFHGWCKACNNASAKRKRQTPAERARQAELARRDAAEAERPALRTVRLLREQIEADRAEAEAFALWRRGKGPRPATTSARLAGQHDWTRATRKLDGRTRQRAAGGR